MCRKCIVVCKFCELKFVLFWGRIVVYDSSKRLSYFGWIKEEPVQHCDIPGQVLLRIRICSTMGTLLQFRSRRKGGFSSGWQEISPENYDALISWIWSEKYSLGKLKVACAFLFLHRPWQVPTLRELKTVLPKNLRDKSKFLEGIYDEVLTELKDLTAAYRKVTEFPVRVPYDVLRYLSQHASREKFILVMEGCRKMARGRHDMFHLNTQHIARCVGGYGAGYREAIRDMKHRGLLKEYPTTIDHRRRFGKLYAWESSCETVILDGLSWYDRLRIASS